MLQGPGQINKQIKLQTTVGGGGGSDHPKKTPVSAPEYTVPYGTEMAVARQPVGPPDEKFNVDNKDIYIYIGHLASSDPHPPLTHAYYDCVEELVIYVRLAPTQLM